MKGTIGQFTKLKKNYGPWDFHPVNNSIILIVALGEGLAPAVVYNYQLLKANHC